MGSMNTAIYRVQHPMHTTLVAQPIISWEKLKVSFTTLRQVQSMFLAKKCSGDLRVAGGDDLPRSEL